MTLHDQASRCFLSYSRAHLGPATELHGLLKDAGLEVFWDVESIRSGDDWIDRIESSLADCQKFVLLVGDDGVTGWHRNESAAALDLNAGGSGCPEICPVLLDTTPLKNVPLLLKRFQTVQWKPGEPLPKGLVTNKGPSPGGERATGLRPGQNPYRGLAPFAAHDGDIFFGRDKETLFALNRLGDQSERPANPDYGEPPGGRSYNRWLQIEGNSGCGKSSLVLGGMLPEIEGGALWARTRIKEWQVLGPMMPGRTPFRNLVIAIRQCMEAGSKVERPAGSSELIKEMKQVAPDGVVLKLRDTNRAGGAFLLIVDQFEELFTLAEDEERAEFDRQLARAMQDRDCPLFIISTIRSDFLDRMERLPQLFEYYSKRCVHYALPTISQQGMHELIETRSLLANVDPSEVSALILGDAQGESGALPLIENALDVLWKNASEATKASGGQRHPGDRLRLSGDLYLERGRLAGLLSAGADELIAEINKSVKGHGQAAALEVLLALTRVNPKGQHTRRGLSYEEAVSQGGGEGAHVLSMLAGEHPPNASTENRTAVNRLVVIEGKRDVASGVDARTVNLIHETLIRTRLVGEAQKPYWETLYNYIAEHPDRDYLRQQVELRARPWDSAARLRRWVHLSYWAGLWKFRRLQFSADSPEGRYLRASRQATGIATLLATAVVVPPIALGAHVVAWSDEHKFPPKYVALGLGWYVGLRSIPEVVRVPREGRPGSNLLMRGAAVTPFELGKFEVTFEEYDYFVWSNRRAPDPPTYPIDTFGRGRGSNPVINVNWDDAQRYVHWLTEKTRQDWRLPTGTQWEFAARAGDDSGDQTQVWQGPARCDGCGNTAGENGPNAGGSYPSSTWGLFDIAGNVAEWVDDRATPETPSRFVRGGGWIHERRSIGVLAVASLDAREAVNWVGFRVARLPVQSTIR